MLHQIQPRPIFRVGSRCKSALRKSTECNCAKARFNADHAFLTAGSRFHRDQSRGVGQVDSIGIKLQILYASANISRKIILIPLNPGKGPHRGVGIFWNKQFLLPVFLLFHDIQSKCLQSIVSQRVCLQSLARNASAVAHNSVVFSI